MRRMILAQLRGRPGRAIALLLGIMVATTSFTVLSSTAATSRLEVTGTVRDNFRSAYDVLVRPPGVQSAAERQGGSVAPNFLAGIYGGISLEQWKIIQEIPGVDVAAPVSMIGYVMPTVPIAVDITDKLSDARRQTLRVTTTSLTDRGTSNIRQPNNYLYVTRNRLTTSGVAFDPTTEQTARGSRHACQVTMEKAVTPFTADWPSGECWSTTTGLDGQGGYGELAVGQVGHTMFWKFPMLIAAIDPESEARLARLDKAVVSGRYLRPGDAIGSNSGGEVSVPALVAERSSLDETAEVSISLLNRTAIGLPADPSSLDGLPGTEVFRQRITAKDAYRQLLEQMSGTSQTNFFQGLDGYWNIGPTSLGSGSGAASPRTVINANDIWRSDFQFSGFVRPPFANADTQFRRIVQHESVGGDDQRLAMPAARPVGFFDPERLPPFNPLTKVPLGVYEPGTASPADAASRSALQNQDLLPNRNLGGYITESPQILTTLAALPAFTGKAFSGDTHRADPISTIRVRVTGVTGPDPVSRERVRQVAEEIAKRTGLQVDITVGSSPSAKSIRLPAGKFGRPVLTLSQDWVKKGVAVSILTALDRKSLALFGLILVVCALFVGNAAGAAVRTRRVELGVLACLGWSPGRLFGALLGEVAVVGLVAGILGSGLALAGANLFDLNAEPTRAAIAVPAAVLLAIFAGVLPAWRASRADPGSAVRPAVSDARHAHRLHTLSGLAFRNVTRTWGRSLLAASALAVGTAALTMLLAITIAFRGVLIGSLLGDAVTVQVRPADLAGVLAIILLASAAVADVLYLGVRERASELSTLRVTGWDERTLQRLIGYEAALIGLCGSVTGVLLGTVGSALLAGGLPGRVLVVAPAIVAAGISLAVLAAIAPALALRRLPTTELLAEE